MARMVITGTVLRAAAAVALLALGACGVVQPGTPGHEPPGGSTNPITGTRGSGNN